MLTPGGPRGPPGREIRRPTCWTLGYAHQIGPSTRLTLAQEIAKDATTKTGDNVTTFQIQVRY